jgi:uncharacterized protein (UPF0332 family)
MALECLSAAELSLENDHYKFAANRSYYCIFHAMRAILALDGFDAKRHSGVISEFQRLYIKSKLFPAGFSRVITGAFEVRGKCDYDDFYIVSKSEVSRQLDGAREFLAAARAYLDSAEL